MARSSKNALDAPFRRMKKQKDEETAKTTRLCDEPGCKHPGEYRAPKDRHHLDEHYFFCQQHVTAYNKSWNYFKNMTHVEMDEDRRRDHTWGRSTKPFGNSAKTKKRNKAFTGKVNDLFGVFAEEDKNVSEFESRKTLNRLPKEYKEAFEAMDLITAVNNGRANDLSTKELARALHPDLNPDDPDCEDKLKKVNTAYNTLKKRPRSWTITRSRRALIGEYIKGWTILLTHALLRVDVRPPAPRPPSVLNLRGKGDR